MIKIILSGGLGNQMFQYAAGKALSIRLKTGLCVDLYKLTKKTRAIPRNFELDIFDNQIKEISTTKNKLVVKLFSFLKGNKLGQTILYLSGVFCDHRAQEYDLGFENLGSEVTLFGYFQNENYFKEYSEQIRKDFGFKRELSSRNVDIKAQIEESTSISLHIRRGDYMAVNSNLPVLDITYYQRAIEYVNRHVKNPSYFIFSDDIEWVKDNLGINNPDFVYVDWNRDEFSYVDMQLISLCKHNIIANSSFSWWGAWLNNNPDKLVIAPDIWYKNDVRGGHPDGFIPEKWIIL